MFYSRFSPLFAFFVSVFMPFGASAAEYVTNPVGYVEVPLPAESDSILAVPLLPSNVLEAEILTVEDDVWFLGINGVSSNLDAAVLEDGCFIQVNSGTYKGYTFPILACEDDGILVDYALMDVVPADLEGCRVKVHPYWRLGALFEALESFHPTVNISGAGAELEVLLSDVRAGINLSSSHTYYYYNGPMFGGPGWREVGTNFMEMKDDLLIDHESLFIIRNKSADGLDYCFAGEVSMTSYVTQLLRLSDDSPQDNKVGALVPVEMTLSESCLYESGAFRGTSNLTGSGGDLLLMYDTSKTGYNLATSSTYYYYTGSMFGGPGWRKVGGNFMTIEDDAVVFLPGRGFIIRKASDGTISADVWSIETSYEE